nr:MAG TPA: hypothetical protein [Caudoviricetes sp.]
MRRRALRRRRRVDLERLTRSVRASKVTSWATRSARSSAATAAFSPLAGSLAMLTMTPVLHMNTKVTI